MKKRRSLFKFNAAARQSLADELKLAAWGGSGLFAFLAYITENGWFAIAIMPWLLLFQLLAHMLIAIQD